MTGAIPYPLLGKKAIMEFLGVGESVLRDMIRDGAPIRRTKRGYMRAEGWRLWDFYEEWLLKDDGG